MPARAETVVDQTTLDVADYQRRRTAPVPLTTMSAPVRTAGESASTSLGPRPARRLWVVFFVTIAVVAVAILLRLLRSCG
jgi:hypothetical protein